MPSPEEHPSTYTRLLRGAAVVCALMGAGVVTWLVDKALRYPEVRAAQAGAEAPLWIPFALFVAVGTAAVVVLFLKAARRVEAGERLFANRHRRRGDEETENG